LKVKAISKRGLTNKTMKKSIITTKTQIQIEIYSFLKVKYKSKWLRRLILILISLRNLSLKIVMKILINKVLVIGCIDPSSILNSSRKKVKNWLVNLNLRAVWLLDKLWGVLASVDRRVLMMDLFKKVLFLLMLNFLLASNRLFMLGDLMIIIRWVIYL